MWIQITCVVLAAAAGSGILIYCLFKLKKMKTGRAGFLDQHPDAAKIYLAPQVPASSGVVQVTSIDGELPQYFQESEKAGFYAMPGSRIVEMRYLRCRREIPGGDEAENTGPAKKELVQELEVEAHKTYLLGFDRETDSFTFEQEPPPGGEAPGPGAVHP